jgi:phosphoribosylglycinamide formyltransferase-1
MAQPFRICVLISGGGTTLKNLIDEKSKGELRADIVQVISNNPEAVGLQFALDANLETQIINHRDFRGVQPFSDTIFDQCRTVQADLVVMAGFLRRLVIPTDFANRVINIHPSLIPAFCGKGHYGQRVHEAVIQNGCKISGCTVHFVDDHYDHCPIIAHRTVPVLDDDTPDTLAKRVFVQECQVYPEVINWIAAQAVSVRGRHVTVAGNTVHG